MYFLRRRHGRKPPPEARREIPQTQITQTQAPAPYAAPLYDEAEPAPPAPPKIITKTRRPRVVDSPDAEDCKPAGTFRAGTLHLDRRAGSDATQGKL